MGQSTRCLLSESEAARQSPQLPPITNQQQANLVHAVPPKALLRATMQAANEKSTTQSHVHRMIGQGGLANEFRYRRVDPRQDAPGQMVVRQAMGRPESGPSRPKPCPAARIDADGTLCTHQRSERDGASSVISFDSPFIGSSPPWHHGVQGQLRVRIFGESRLPPFLVFLQASIS